MCLWFLQRLAWRVSSMKWTWVFLVEQVRFSTDKLSRFIWSGAGGQRWGWALCSLLRASCELDKKDLDRSIINLVLLLEANHAELLWGEGWRGGGTNRGGWRDDKEQVYWILVSSTLAFTSEPKRFCRTFPSVRKIGGAKDTGGLFPGKWLGGVI